MSLNTIAMMSGTNTTDAAVCYSACPWRCFSGSSPFSAFSNPMPKLYTPAEQVGGPCDGQRIMVECDTPEIASPDANEDLHRYVRDGETADGLPRYRHVGGFWNTLAA